MTTTSRLTWRGLLLLALVAVVPALVACEKAKPPRKVRVSVVVILASEKDDKVDKKLECIAREVRKMHPRFKGFRMANLSCKSVAVGAADVFELVEKQRASITVQSAADKMDRVQLKLGPPMMGEITYSTPCGKFLPILTPYRTKGNDQVLIAVRVQPCHGNNGK
jgi:hypothetical protein